MFLLCTLVIIFQLGKLTVFAKTLRTCLENPFFFPLTNLRNSLCHSDRSEIDKPTFDQYVQLAKEAFKALGIITDPTDVIGGLTESDFPTKQVRRLEERLRQEIRSYIECLEEVTSGVEKLVAQGNAIEEKVDNLALKMKKDQDKTGIN